MRNRSTHSTQQSNTTYTRVMGDTDRWQQLFCCRGLVQLQIDMIGVYFAYSEKMAYGVFTINPLKNTAGGICY